MGKAARRVISCACLFISIPSGIISLLMLFTILKGIDTTGCVYALPPLKSVVEDLRSGAPLGVLWPVLLMAIHVILSAVLARHWLALGAPGAGAGAEEANA